MGSDFGNTGSCHRFYSCNGEKRENKHQKGLSSGLCRHLCTDLLLRKQFWITLMMKEAASFSLKPGLKRCLQVTKKIHPDLILLPSFVGSFKHKQTLLYSLEQLNGLSSEAGEASIQHERYQGDHRIHVGPDAPQGCLWCYVNAYFRCTKQKIIFKNRSVKKWKSTKEENKWQYYNSNCAWKAAGWRCTLFALYSVVIWDSSRSANLSRSEWIWMIPVLCIKDAVLLFSKEHRLYCRCVLYHPAYSPDSQVSPHTHLHEPFEGSRLHFPTHDHHHLVS